MGGVNPAPTRQVPLGRSSVTSHGNASASRSPRSWLVTGPHGLGADEAGEVEERLALHRLRASKPSSRGGRTGTSRRSITRRCCARFSRPRQANSALVFKTCHPAARGKSSSGTTLIAKREWNRDDISNLSSSFDDAISSSALADIEMLAHEWLAADKPQLVELNAGRRIGDSLVATAEHRVIQLRRADDFVSGRTSHTLVQQELKATTSATRRSHPDRRPNTAASHGNW